jgi:hypothetical protein
MKPRLLQRETILSIVTTSVTAEQNPSDGPTVSANAPALGQTPRILRMATWFAARG